MLLKSITIVWSLVILFLSLYPFQVKADSIQLWQHTDKIIHFSMYAVLTFFVALCVNPKNWLDNKSWLIVVICSLYGIIIELLQEIMKLGRSFDFLDIIANSLGVFFALTGYFTLKKHKFFALNKN